MKKIIFFVGSLCMTTGLNAQIKITAADMPTAPSEFILSMAAVIDTTDLKNTGENHSWDFSYLKPYAQRKDPYIPTSAFPFPYNLLFTSKNTSNARINELLTSGTIPGVKLKGAYDFFRTAEYAYLQVGAGYIIDNTPLPLIYQKADIIYQFPVKYLNTDSCDFSFQLQVPSFGYYGQKGHRSNLVDGWGELKTPLGTFSTLRIVSTVDVTDSLYGESDSVGLKIKRPTRCEFKWLAKGSGIPVLQIDAIKVNGQLVKVYNVTYMDTLRSDIIHVNIDHQKENSAIQLYPNPANDRCTIAYSLDRATTVKITVTDVLGRELLIAADQTEMKGMKKQSIDVSGLPEGIYFVNIQLGNQHSINKLIVAH